MSKLIDYLESINLLSEQELWDYICENDIETLDTLIIYLRRLIDEDFQKSEYTPFTFVPNADISGTGGCNEISCRMSRAQKFAVFSALYADKVYIQLQFITDEHYDFCDIDEIEADEELSLNFRMALLSDLIMILVYAQLIKNKIVFITPSHQMLCPACFQRELFGNEIVDIENITSEYLERAHLILRNYDKENNEAQLTIDGIKEFFPDHDLFWNIRDREKLDLLKYEKVGAVVPNKKYANEFISDFIKSEITAAMYSTKYCYEQHAKLITNKLSDAMFLSLNRDSSIAEVENYTKMLPEYDLLITHNLSLKNVIRLRKEEEESFNKYRIALNKAIKEQNNATNVTDWKAIYDDIVYPQFNNLDLKMKQIKQGRLNRFFGSMIVIGTSLIVSKFGNSIVPNVFSNVDSFKTTIGAAGVNYKLDKSSTKKADLQNNDYFFLWKLKQKSK